jgi:hypothetical protein
MSDAAIPENRVPGEDPEVVAHTGDIEEEETPECKIMCVVQV